MQRPGLVLVGVLAAMIGLVMFTTKWHKSNIPYVEKMEKEEAADRRNYSRSDNISYLDGDEPDYIKYDFGASTMVDDHARVYKGGSWKDRAYWMSPGSRRYLDEKHATDYIGFRCAMVRLGSPVGLGTKRKGGGKTAPIKHN